MILKVRQRGCELVECRSVKNCERRESREREDGGERTKEEGGRSEERIIVGGFL